MPSSDAYSATVLALGAFGALHLLQLLVSDVAGIRRRHQPGTPPAGGHDDFHFRSFRAFANSVESTGAFLLIAAFAVLRQADAAWVNGLVWTFVGARAGHMLCYWLDLRILRSGAFAVGALALVGLLLVGALR